MMDNPDNHIELFQAKGNESVTLEMSEGRHEVAWRKLFERREDALQEYSRILEQMLDDDDVVLHRFGPEVVAGVTLSLARGVGPVALKRLHARYGSFEEVLTAARGGDSSLLAAFKSLRDTEVSHESAVQALKRCLQSDIRVSVYGQPDYPRQVAKIKDPPGALYVRGKLDLDARLAACIGTRHSTSYGDEVARRCCSRLVDAGWGTVSGLAIGIDAASHSATLEKGGYTIAVLANGLDTIYPSTNAKLAARILEKGGCLISEHPPGTPANRYTLVARDRIQSALAEMIFVIQAGTDGGTMHTVRFAEDQKKTIICPVPPQKFQSEPSYAGVIKLLKERRAIPLDDGNGLEGILQEQVPGRRQLTVGESNCCRQED